MANKFDPNRYQMNPVVFEKLINPVQQPKSSPFDQFAFEIQKLFESEPQLPASEKAIAAFKKLGPLDFEKLWVNKFLQVGRDPSTKRIYLI